MSFMFDQMLGSVVNWGDNLSKAMSADFEPTRDYFAETTGQDSVLGSPFSQMLEMMRYGYDLRPIPEEYRTLQPSAVETLMVNGNLDISTPAIYARDELLLYFENGSLVVLDEMGHVSDVVNLQPEAFSHLASNFFRDGTVDASRFVYQQVDFIPTQSFPGLAKRIVTIAAAAVVVLGLALAASCWYLRRRWVCYRSRRVSFSPASIT